MFKEKGKESIVNKILIAMLAIIGVFAGAIILLPQLNKKNVETHVKEAQGMIQNYTTIEENTWDVSKNGDGSVTATLSEDGTLIISGTGDMKDWSWGVTTEWHNSKIQRKVKNVIINSGVTSIGREAFRYCSSLISIKIADTITNIGDSALSGCSSLIEIKVDEYNSKYMDDNGVLYTKDKKEIIKYPSKKEGIEYTILEEVTSIAYEVFSGCSSLTTIRIPSNVTIIGTRAFSGCSSLTEINIPNGVTSIGIGAFESCVGLISIDIPSSVTSINSNVFYGCTNLKEIIVDENNLKYIDDEGVLYTKDRTQIIQYPAQKENTEYEILDGVTIIEYATFYRCSKLIKIKLPDSVRNIEMSAFSNCKSLMSINIPQGIIEIKAFTFSDCSSLKEIEIPEGVTNIGESSFSGCSNLRNINIPNTVITIGRAAFRECKNLTSISIPQGVSNIGDRAFEECRVIKFINSKDELELPDFLKRTQKEGDILYSNKEFLLTNCTIDGTKIIINEYETVAEIKVQEGKLAGLTYMLSGNEWDISEDRDGSVIATLLEDGTLNIAGIGNIKKFDYYSSDSEMNDMPAWYNMEISKRIRNVVINNGITSVGDNLFRECSNLTSVIIPEGVTSIGYSVFYNCTRLTTIKIPSSVSIIENYVFSGCDNLTRIEVDDNNVHYMDDNGVLYTKDKAKIIKYPSKKEESTYTINEDVTIIGNEAFRDCSSLVSINIPEGVTRIEEWAFSNCSSLKNIKIPKTVSSIYGAAFNECSSLVSINIPETVTEIRSNLFMYCGELSSINIPEGVTCIGRYAFYGCTSLASIKMPRKLTKIESDAFSRCKNLREIEISSSVADIGKNSFYGCKNLMIICEIDSTAHNYSKENKIDYLATRYRKVNDYFKGIQPDITYESFINSIDTNMEYQIIENSNKIEANILIKTGQQLVIEDRSFTLVVTGDTNGDGQANLKDILAINKHRLNKAQLANEYLQAGDVNQDQKADLRDILQINKYRLGKINQL